MLVFKPLDVVARQATLMKKELKINSIGFNILSFHMTSPSGIFKNMFTDNMFIIYSPSHQEPLAQPFLIYISFGYN